MCDRETENKSVLFSSQICQGTASCDWKVPVLSLAWTHKTLSEERLTRNGPKFSHSKFEFETNGHSVG